jgi:hypothetical protein
MELEVLNMADVAIQLPEISEIEYSVPVSEKLSSSLLQDENAKNAKAADKQIITLLFIGENLLMLATGRRLKLCRSR